MTSQTKMTAEQIEMRVCRETDVIDASYMAGRMTEAEYRREISKLDRWAERQFARC